MFTYTICQSLGCTQSAITPFYEDSEGKKCYCLQHTPNQELAKQSIYQYLRTHDKIIGLVANGMSFADVDFSNKNFYGCSFQHCSFSNIKTINCRSRLTLFDFSIFTDCSFLESSLQFTSFAGAAFSHVLFTGSDLACDQFNQS